MAAARDLSITMMAPMVAGKNGGWWKVAREARHERVKNIVMQWRGLIAECHRSGIKTKDLTTYALERLSKSDQVMLGGQKCILKELSKTLMQLYKE